MTKQEFLDRAREMHGYKYQYPNLTDKILSQDNIDIIYNNLNIIYTSNTNIPQLMSSSFHRQHIFPKIKETLIIIRQDLI